MLKFVEIRRDGEAKNAKRDSLILDVLQTLAEREYGTARNALRVLIESSSRFKRTAAKLRQSQQEPAEE